MEIKNTLTNLVDPYRTQVDAAAKETRSTYGRQSHVSFGLTKLSRPVERESKVSLDA